LVREHFVVQFRLGATERYLIWYVDDVDVLILNEEGKLLVLVDVEALRRYATQNGLKLATAKPTWYDFDALSTWLEMPAAQSIDPSAFLNAGNRLGDVRSSLIGRSTVRDPDGGSRIYEKLFRTNNLPSVAPRGVSCEPDWTEADIRDLVRVPGDGLQLFRSALARE